jgi:hypothetical protein
MGEEAPNPQSSTKHSRGTASVVYASPDTHVSLQSRYLRWVPLSGQKYCTAPGHRAHLHNGLGHSFCRAQQLGSCDHYHTINGDGWYIKEMGHINIVILPFYLEVC